MARNTCPRLWRTIPLHEPAVVNYLCAGSYATYSRQPRQVRKEATVTGRYGRSGETRYFFFAPIPSQSIREIFRLPMRWASKLGRDEAFSIRVLTEMRVHKPFSFNENGILISQRGHGIIENALRWRLLYQVEET